MADTKKPECRRCSPELRLSTIQKMRGGSIYIVANRGDVVIRISGRPREASECFDALASQLNRAEVA